jgi:Tfp pilus assembly protein PilZ
VRKRPVALFVCSLLFLYFPIEFYWKGWIQSQPLIPTDYAFELILPLVLLFGLIRVTKVGWYTLIALVALWGIRDLAEYYAGQETSLSALIVHLAIYAASMTYFINPRIRHLYFDPKARWWRTKPRYETCLPMICSTNGEKNTVEWQYPLLRNISEGGCFIETQHLLLENEEVDMKVPLPQPLNVSVLQVKGEVRWVSKNPLRMGLGIQFKTVPPDQTKAIITFVNKQL